MHRSRTVNLAVVSALATAFSGCAHEKKESVYCVKPTREVVENRYCQNETTFGRYAYWYGPADASYARGQRVFGGETIDASDKSATASRGGFGSSSSSGVGGSITRSSFSGGS